MVPEKPETHTRILAALTAMGSIIWAQWPIDIARIGIGPIFTGGIALVTWLSIEIASLIPEAEGQDSVLPDVLNNSVDDVMKINKIIKIIDKRHDKILRESYFNNSINNETYLFLEKVYNYYKNDTTPFHNKEIQELYNNLCRKIQIFLTELRNIYQYDEGSNITWKTSDERYNEIVLDEVVRSISRLSQSKAELSDMWTALLSTASKQLAGSIAIDRYRS